MPYSAEYQHIGYQATPLDRESPEGKTMNNQSSGTKRFVQESRQLCGRAGQRKSKIDGRHVAAGIMPMRYAPMLETPAPERLGMSR
jgi:hypothetical protein